MFFVPKKIRLNSTHYFVMEIQNKRQLHQIAFNHLPDIYFQDFINICKKSTAETYLFLVIGTTPASDNSSRLRKNLLEAIETLIITNDDKIKFEKLQHNINREAAKISASS